MKAAIFPNTVNVHLFYKGCTLPFDNNVDLRKGARIDFAGAEPQSFFAALLIGRKKPLGMHTGFLRARPRLP